jgi:ribose 5-phosphate isomerase A
MIEACKKAAAEKAATLVEEGMTVGLGTGSTAAYFIEALSRRHKKGLKTQVVASSHASHLLAQQAQLPLIDLSSLKFLDLYVDGADEIDPKKQMIKGAGGALLREKILAHMSREMTVIIDETKLVSHLGARPLPVEIIPFGLHATLHHLHQLGYRGSLRSKSDNTPWMTENNNYIYDIQLSPSSHISQDHDRICTIPGVVETGFFQNQAGRVIIGFKDGSVVVQ